MCYLIKQLGFLDTVIRNCTVNSCKAAIDRTVAVMPVGITFRLTLWKALASLVLGALAMGVALSIIGHDTDGDLNSYSR